MARALADGRFATIVELRPPKGCLSDEVVEQARLLKSRGVDVVHVPDGSRGARMSALSLAVLLQEHARVETVLQYACRDRNLLGMQSDLLGAHAMGVRNVMLVTGDVHTVGDYPDATGVFDVDSIGLTNVVTRLNQGLDVGGQPIGSPTAFHIGVLVNPGSRRSRSRNPSVRVQARSRRRVRRDETRVRCRHLRAIPAHESTSARLPLLVGLWPFESVLNAEFMANEVPGVRVPEAVLERMRRAGAAGPEAAVAEGVAIACEIGRELEGAVQGVHIATPSDRIESVIEVLSGLR